MEEKLKAPAGANTVDTTKSLVSVPYLLAHGLAMETKLEKAPAVSSLLNAPVGIPMVLLTTQNVTQPAGLYYLDHTKAQWKFAFPYDDLNLSLFYPSPITLNLPVSGETELAVFAALETSDLIVLRNGYEMTVDQYTTANDKITLKDPARAGEYFTIMVPGGGSLFNGGGGGQGGIPDTPKTTPQVRVKGGWQELSEQELDEGTY
ncbi:hypothetical protein [Burkholderia phage BCSR5]|nr:hypothetical protein [Burkholderia phage BCSR5]